MDKRPAAVIEAAKRIAIANKMSTKEVFARYSAVVKKTAYSEKDFLIVRR